ncbi:MAG: hypothetical protein M1326_00790 [Cyanobacteria bacterium]|nr:hypothetical protein [Cyanobacteriota bacterium]
MQNLRYRALSVLKKKEPYRLPWFGDLSYWYYAMSRKGNLEKRYIGLDGIINLHKDLNCGFYLQGYFPFKPVYRNCEVYEMERNTNTTSDFAFEYRCTKIIKRENNDDIIREVETPVGTIKEKWSYCKESYSLAPTQYFVNTVQDLKVFKYWVENTSYMPDYRQAYIVKNTVGDIGFTLCYLPRSPLMQFIVEYAGIVNTVNIMMTDKKLFNETMKILEYKSDEAAEIALGSPAELLMIPENLSSDLVGKNFYEEYLRPYEEKWNEKIKAKGKYSFIHMDGYLKGLLKEVSEAKFSVIEAMTPKPVGDINIDEFSNYVKSDSIMWGGIPGALFTPSTSNEYFEEFVKKVIGVMISEPRYVLGIADQIPPDGIIERVKIVSDLVERYGIYKYKSK